MKGITNPRDTLAPYAISSTASAGRLHDEPPDALRDPFALDRHRIVECTAFRRLEHKTQVFAPGLDDHIRTRLTHTLEASLIARTLACPLHVNEALAEAITLAHDLGHPPFGHAGEVALDKLMQDRGGFNHNAHSVRVVEYLEHPFPPFRGLNLTHETLDGLGSHATRYDVPSTSGGSLDGHRGSIEARVASFADRIAYDCHDLEDAIGARLIGLNELSELSIWGDAYDQVAADYADRSIHAVRRHVLDMILDRVLLDVVHNSAPRLAGLTSPQEAAASYELLVAPSGQIESELVALESFLHRHVYKHADVARSDEAGQIMIRRLFNAYLADPKIIPDRFSMRIAEQGPYRVICDYIAGMTDRFCRSACERLD